MVVPFGMESVPLPPTTPEVQVIDAPVRLIGAVPSCVPPCIASVGTERAEALLRVSVPPVRTRSPTLTMEPIVVVPPLARVDPVTVLLPEFHCTVPAPLMLDVASKVRVSL